MRILIIFLVTVLASCGEYLIKKPVIISSGKLKVEVIYMEKNIHMIASGSGSYYVPTEGREFIKVFCRITNNSVFPLTVAMKDFTVTNEKIIAEPAYSFRYKSKDLQTSIQLAEKGSSTIILYFSWPRDASPLFLNHPEAGTMAIPVIKK